LLASGVEEAAKKTSAAAANRETEGTALPTQPREAEAAAAAAAVVTNGFVHVVPLLLVGLKKEDDSKEGDAATTTTTTMSTNTALMHVPSSAGLQCVDDLFELHVRLKHVVPRIRLIRDIAGKQAPHLLHLLIKHSPAPHPQCPQSPPDLPQPALNSSVLPLLSDSAPIDASAHQTTTAATTTTADSETATTEVVGSEVVAADDNDAAAKAETDDNACTDAQAAEADADAKADMEAWALLRRTAIMNSIAKNPQVVVSSLKQTSEVSLTVTRKQTALATDEGTDEGTDEPSTKEAEVEEDEEEKEEAALAWTTETWACHRRAKVMGAASISSAAGPAAVQGQGTKF